MRQKEAEIGSQAFVVLFPRRRRSTSFSLFANALLPLKPPKPDTGPDADRCAALIEAHKVCLRAEGFQVE